MLSPVRINLRDTGNTEFTPSPYRWIVPDSAALPKTVAVDDLHKLALITSTGVTFRLSNVSPAQWSPMTAKDLELTSRVGVTETKITAAEKKIGAAETKINTAETNIGSVTSRVGVTETKITAAEKKINTAETKITAAEKNISSVTGRVSAAETKITAAETKITAAETKIVSINNLKSLGYDLTVKTVTNGAINVNAGQVFKIPSNGSRSISISNATTTGRMRTIAIMIEGAGAVTWPGTVKWTGGAAQVLGSSYTLIVLAIFESRLSGHVASSV